MKSVFTLSVFLLLIMSSCSQSENLVESPLDEVVETPEEQLQEETLNINIPAPAENFTGLDLVYPENTRLEIFADNVSEARDLEGPDAQGNYWLSRTREGIVTRLDIEDGVVVNQVDVFKNLRNPHGLALDIDRMTLFIAEEDSVSKIRLYSDAPLEKLVDLPTGGRHTTRSLLLGPDDRIYVSIGSSCDVCYEDDERRSAVYVMNKDGSEFQSFATGLRNAVFLTTNYVTGDIWATEMGRDHLGDDLPPDEINILREGQNYGWPICYGNNIHDSVFDKNQYIQNPCTQAVPSHIDLQAHSAPLGLSFVPEEGWPEDWWYNLLVAYHGSWNRSIPTGYKIMRIKLDAQGNEIGREDFISGWLDENENKQGRPVDLLIQPGGILYITDDRKGVVYKMTLNTLE